MRPYLQIRLWTSKPYACSQQTFLILRCIVVVDIDGQLQASKQASSSVNNWKHLTGLSTRHCCWTAWNVALVFCWWNNARFAYNVCPPCPPLDNIRVMVIVWRLRGNIIRTAPCWVVWHNVHSQQPTHVSSSYRSSRLALSNWDPYAVHRGGCLELYYCNMVEWSWWDSSLISKTNWFPSVLWYCWFGHMTCKYCPLNDL